MGQHRGVRALSLTSSDALLKESCEYRQRPLQHLRSAHEVSSPFRWSAALCVEQGAMSSSDPASWRFMPGCRASQTLWPLLPTVENGDNLQAIASQPVRDHVPGARHHQFPCTYDSTRTAQIRQFSKTLDCVEQRGSNLVGGFGVVARNVRTEVSQMFDRSRRPDDDHARGAFRSRLRPHEWSQFATSLCGTPRP